MTLRTPAEVAKALKGWIEYFENDAPAPSLSGLTDLREAIDLLSLSALSGVREEVCPRCKGSGEIDVTSFVEPSKTIKNRCTICKGSKWLARPGASEDQRAAQEINGQNAAGSTADLAQPAHHPNAAAGSGGEAK